MKEPAVWGVVLAARKPVAPAIKARDAVIANNTGYERTKGGKKSDRRRELYFLGLVGNSAGTAPDIYSLVRHGRHKQA